MLLFYRALSSLSELKRKFHNIANPSRNFTNFICTVCHRVLRSSTKSIAEDVSEELIDTVASVIAEPVKKAIIISALIAFENILLLESTQALFSKMAVHIICSYMVHLEEKVVAHALKILKLLSEDGNNTFAVNLLILSCVVQMKTSE